MPKTGGAGDLAWAALGLLGLLAIGGGVALRRRKARL
jgi:LPXTG-motif cell wall-anchored protein